MKPKRLMLSMAPVLLLVGCGLSTFTQRETDPYIRDFFFNQTQPVAITVTASSRRLIYEFKSRGRNIVCSDASPDTSIAAFGAVGGEVNVSNGNASGALKGQRLSATAPAPLVRRSQGLQWGRDNAALECQLFAMGVTTKQEYLYRLDAIRAEAKEIINHEIANGLSSLAVGSGVSTLEKKTDSLDVKPGAGAVTGELPPSSLLPPPTPPPGDKPPIP